MGLKKKSKFSEEHRRNLSKAHKGKIVSKETRRKLSLAAKGKPTWNKGKKGYTNSGSFKKGHKLSEEAMEKRRQQLIGKKNPFYGKTHSEETKRKIGKANRGRTISEKTRRKMSLASTGRIVSEKTRRKISNLHKGKVVSDETKRKWRSTRAKNYPDGFKHSEEARRKLSKAHKGRIFSEESKRKMRGRIVSEETRGKLRLLGTGRKHSEKSKRKIRKARARQVISEEHMRNFRNSMKGRKHSEESKRKMSEAQMGKIFSKEHRRRIKQKRLEQVFPIKDTKIEIKLQELLKENNIKFETHKSIIGQPDIIIEPNILIFADGDYWHGWFYLNGKDYSKQKGLNNEFFEKKIRDDKRITRKLRHDGFKVLRFWEHEIKKDPEKCLRTIINALDANVN